MSEVFIRKPYDPHARYSFACVGASMAKQSMKDECDINNIMKKFYKTGLLEHAREHAGQYGNFIGAPEYHEACNQVLEAEAMFQSVPARLRKRFNNDPAEFLAFVQDPANTDELVSMGLAEARKASAAPEAPETGGGAEATGEAGSTEGAIE